MCMCTTTTTTTTTTTATTSTTTTTDFGFIVLYRDKEKRVLGDSEFQTPGASYHALGPVNRQIHWSDTKCFEVLSHKGVIQLPEDVTQKQ